MLKSERATAADGQVTGTSLSPSSRSVTSRHTRPEIAVLKRSDWEKLRSARLRALLEDQTKEPHAFAADHASELNLRPEAWRQRIDESTWVIFEYGPEVVGLACLARPQADDVNVVTGARVRYIESVWVAPPWRWQGLALAMIEELERRAKAENVTLLALWVIAGNDGAWNAYVKMGFAPTGEESQLLTAHGTVQELRMTKVLI